MPLFDRNTIDSWPAIDTNQGIGIQQRPRLQSDPTQPGFEIPPGYEKPTSWNVAKFWLDELTWARLEHNWTMDCGLRPASLLLKDYAYIDILRATRWSVNKCSRLRRPVSLWWVRKKMPEFLRKYGSQAD